MTAAASHNWRYFSGALFIHVLLALLFFGMSLTSHQTVVPQLAISATMIDRATFNQMLKSAATPAPLPQTELKPAPKPDLRQIEQAQQEAKAKAEQQKQQTQQRLDAAAKEHEAELKRIAEAQQQAAQRQADTKRQQQAAEQQRLTDIQQKQHELEKQRQAATDAKAQSAREAELKAQLADEEGRTQAVNAGLLNQYVALLNQRVERNWTKPPSAQPGLQCEVKVAQALGGTVLSVEIGRCNGDQAVRQSVEAAVYRSSPLPAPPDTRLFDRNLNFIFKPVE